MSTAGTAATETEKEPGTPSNRWRRAGTLLLLAIGVGLILGALLVPVYSSVGCCSGWTEGKAIASTIASNIDAQHERTGDLPPIEPGRPYPVNTRLPNGQLLHEWLGMPSMEFTRMKYFAATDCHLCLYPDGSYDVRIYGGRLPGSPTGTYTLHSNGAERLFAP